MNVFDKIVAIFNIEMCEKYLFGSKFAVPSGNVIPHMYAFEKIHGVRFRAIARGAINVSRYNVRRSNIRPPPLPRHLFSPIFSTNIVIRTCAQGGGLQRPSPSKPTLSPLAVPPCFFDIFQSLSTLFPQEKRLMHGKKLKNTIFNGSDYHLKISMSTSS